MIYMLDTDTVIFLVQGFKRTASAKKRTRAKQIILTCKAMRALGNVIGISTISLCELEFGCRNSGQYSMELQVLTRVIKRFVLYPFDTSACVFQYGMTKLHLSNSGTLIGELDLLIASHALALSATVVTNNTAHFNRVPGLKTVNWS